MIEFGQVLTRFDWFDVYNHADEIYDNSYLP